MLLSVLLYHHVTILYIMIYYCAMLCEAVFNLKCWTHPHMMQQMLFCGITVRITPVFFHTQGILSSLMSDLNTNTCLLESLRKGFGISKQRCALLLSAVPLSIQMTVNHVVDPLDKRLCTTLLTFLFFLAASGGLSHLRLSSPICAWWAIDVFHV